MVRLEEPAPDVRSHPLADRADEAVVPSFGFCVPVVVDPPRTGDEKMRLEVRFVRGVFSFLWNGNLDDEFPTGSPTHEWAEVVGNIHENKKLLKGD